MHRDDLNYLLDNMGAETAVGHSYVRGGAMPEVPRPSGDLLGADFEIESERYRIAKIYDTESWSASSTATSTTSPVTATPSRVLRRASGVRK